MRQISARSTRIVKVWGPRISLIVVGVFLVISGVVFFVFDTFDLVMLFPIMIALIVYRGIRKTFRDLTDEVLVGNDGLIVRTGKARERVPFSRIQSAWFEKRKTQGVMMGTLPVINLQVLGYDIGEKNFAFVPKSGKGEMRAATMDATFQALADDLLRRAEDARKEE